MAMTKPTSEQVTFLQAGTNAVPTTSGTVNVRLGVPFPTSTRLNP